VSAREPVPSSYRALEVGSWEGAASLRVVEKPAPELQSGELLVRVLASPVNPSDLAFLKGMYGIQKPLPAVPGFEASGVVVAGKGAAARALVGRRVAFSSPSDRDGTWAEYAVARVTSCFPLRSGVSDEQGAMIIVNPLTAWAFLMRAREGKHKVLVHTAAASALGHWLIRLAKPRKVKLIHVVRRAEQVAHLRSLGEEHVLDSSADDFEATLKKTCRSLGAKIAFDAVGGDTAFRVLRALPRGGELVSYGALSEGPLFVHPGDVIFADKRVTGFWLTRLFDAEHLPRMLQGAVAVQRFVANGATTAVRELVGLDDLAAAIGRYEAKMTEGKVLLVPRR
jgi:NADPH:quinone reductase-like Zn-dependent oxidoreductase